MKRMLKDIYERHIDPRRIMARLNDGKHDLLGALPSALKISSQQKSEIKRFWNPYVKTIIENCAFDMRWFDVYNRINIFGDKLEWYVPDSYYYAVIDPCFNDPIRCQYMDDKNLYDLYFHDVNQAKTICRKEGHLFLDSSYSIISKEKARNLCANCGKIILKPSIGTCAGSGILKWNADQDEFDDLCAILDTPGSFVVQELIRQHESLSQFNDSCVNTIRMVTLAVGDQVDVITAVAIIGGKGAFTNHLHGGGLICGIDSDGSMRPVAFDGKLHKYEKHPSGVVFADCCIPNYYKCVELVKDLAPRLFGTSRLASWDITLDENAEPLLIEVNLQWGGVVQKAAGPVFGERTEEVLKYVRKKS